MQIIKESINKKSIKLDGAIYWPERIEVGQPTNIGSTVRVTIPKNIADTKTGK